MANKGLSMRKVREVLRLHYAAGLSTRAIARSLKVSPATVGKYIRRAEEQGLSWPLPEPLDDAALERRLFPAPVLSATQRPLPQWSEVHRELRQPDVTLALVWQEYKAAHPGGLQYSWFCDQYRAWASKLDVVMRQEHRAGEKLFVDYAGRTVAVVDRHTGELRQAQVFVAVLGASNYTFARATRCIACCATTGCSPVTGTGRSPTARRACGSSRPTCPERSAPCSARSASAR